MVEVVHVTSGRVGQDVYIQMVMGAWPGVLTGLQSDRYGQCEGAGLAMGRRATNMRKLVSLEMTPNQTV